MKLPSTRLKERLTAGTPSLGSFVQIGSPAIIEGLALAGFDFAIVDLEHGSLSPAAAMSLVPMADSHDMPLIARIPRGRLHESDQLMDAGMRGLLVAQVGSVEDATPAVSAVKYPPLGNRGACPGTHAARGGFIEWTDHVAKQNAQNLACIAIEGTAAISHATDVLSVPGLDVVFIGIFDLAASMGLPGQPDHPEVRSEVSKLAKLGAQQNVAVGTWCPTVENAIEWAAEGLSFLPVSIDALLWAEAVRGTVDAWQASR